MKRPLVERETRQTDFVENVDNYSYSIEIGYEKEQLVNVRTCHIVGNRIMILFSKRPQPVKPFPNPEQDTFTPQFK